MVGAVRVNGSKDFLDFLHNDSSGKLMTSSRARFSKFLFGAEIWGILGVKNDPFWDYSSLSLNDFAENLSKDSSTKDLSNHVGHPYLKRHLDP